ncbi:MAG: efflux transporter outer membrane subunit [Proteobacteria bacterium]|nr:efflux transporter outer membrane subunit [Pseudomonadota bacterium]
MKKSITLLLFLLLIQGCSVGPDYQKPNIQVPSSWENGLQSQSPQEHPLTPAWWENFQDPLLNTLMTEALAHNLTLKEALARIESARQQLAQAETSFFPTFTVDGAYERERLSKNAPNYNPAYYLGTYNDVRLGVSTSWELDLFGRIQHAEEMAQATFEISVADAKGVMLTLQASVAQTYIKIRSLQIQLQIQKHLSSLSQEALMLTQDLMSAGRLDQQAVEDAQSTYDSTMAENASLEISFKTALHQLAILLGKPPATLYQLFSCPRSIPLPPPSVFSELPSTLLEHRPDIQAAERALARSTAKIGLLTGDLFPKFSLTGYWGYESTNGTTLIRSKSATFHVGPIFTWPIFDFGRIRDSIKSQEAERDAVFYAYQEVILKALAEVETALITLKNKAIFYQKKETSLAAQKTKLLLTQNLYEAGTIDYLEVIEKQQAALNEDLKTRISAEEYACAAIDLYTALGVGIPRIKENIS